MSIATRAVTVLRHTGNEIALPESVSNARFIKWKGFGPLVACFEVETQLFAVLGEVTRNTPAGPAFKVLAKIGGHMVNDMKSQRDASYEPLELLRP
ncbi:MAG: hypothetical protein KGI04_03655 [Candidatus Micrarchaeota archaeon]|nr:hypothetical protein [Candidatus Micrarchaeota archaeon]